MQENEYGGCLWLELPQMKADYYSAYKKNKIDVDSGRSAIQYIIQHQKYKRIWLPVYNCPLVADRIKRTSQIEIIYYNLREDFFPDIDVRILKKGDAFLWVNYCGSMFCELVDRVAGLQEETEADVIIDNIPAFFSEPRMNVFNIYSCRKFIGVPDGGYIIGTQVKRETLQTYNTAENYYYLLKAMENGSNSAYVDYQKSEERITEEDQAYGMPALTQRILGSVNYEYIKNIRVRNFLVLHEQLGGKNKIKVDFNTQTPSVYPYFVRDKELRQRLIDNKIYVSRFWKHILTNEKANLFEKDLAEYLIPLPIDQRYTEDNMRQLANMVYRLES